MSYGLLVKLVAVTDLLPRLESTIMSPAWMRPRLLA